MTQKVLSPQFKSRVDDTAVIDAFCSQTKLFFIAHPLPAVSKVPLPLAPEGALPQASWPAAAPWWQGARNGRRTQLADKWAANQTNSPTTRTIKKIPFFFSHLPHLQFSAEVGGMLLGKLWLHIVHQKWPQIPPSPTPFCFSNPFCLLSSILSNHYRPYRY